MYHLAHTLYITPDDHHTTNNINTITLSQCLSSTKNCFTSYTQLVFFSGLYYLKKNLVLQNVKYVSIIGSQSIFKCANSSVGITLIRVTNIVVQNIKIKNCNKNYNHVVNSIFSLNGCHNSSIFYHKSALNLLNCVYISIINISITVSPGTDGLVVTNAMMRSELINVLVAMINVLSHNSTAVTNGLFVYYCSKNNDNHYNKQIMLRNLHIQNFTYKQIICSIKGIHNVFYIDFQQNKIEILV